MKKTIICLLALCFAGHVHAFDQDTIQFHGFISQGYLKSSDHDFWFTETSDGTFQFNEMGLSVMSEPVENLRMGIQLLSRDMGEIANNEVEVDWAYGDYYFRSWLGIRAGKLKQPHGLYGQTRDIDSARTGIFLPTGVYTETLRDFFQATQGIGIYGELPAGLSYEFTYGTSSLSSDGGTMLVAKNAYGELKDTVMGKDFSYMLRWDTPVEGLTTAFSGTLVGDVTFKTGNFDLNFTRFDVLIGSLQYEWNDFTIAAEYRNDFVEMDMNGVIVLLDYTREFWHTTGSYRFTDWFELGLGYSVYYTDKDDKNGDRYTKMGQPNALGWRKDLALSTRFDINESWIFKLEGHYMDGLADVTGDLGDDPSEDWFLFATKMTFSF